jgi:hypothetical protein
MKSSIRLKLEQDRMRARSGHIAPVRTKLVRGDRPRIHICPCPVHPESLAYPDGRCKECQKAYRRATYDLIGSTLTERYLATRASAKRRGIPFELTQSEFESIVAQPCFYAVQWHDGLKSGVDRKDSRLGYTKDNCVPCCAKHNLFKSYLTTDQTKDASRRYNVRCENTMGGRKKVTRAVLLKIC